MPILAKGYFGSFHKEHVLLEEKKSEFGWKYLLFKNSSYRYGFYLAPIHRIHVLLCSTSMIILMTERGQHVDFFGAPLPATTLDIYISDGFDNAINVLKARWTIIFSLKHSKWSQTARLVLNTLLDMQICFLFSLHGFGFGATLCLRSGRTEASD